MKTIRCKRTTSDDQKSGRKTLKISPKWSPGQPQMEPERRKNRAKIPKSAVWHLKCSQVGSSRDHNQRAWPQIIDFWVPLGTQIDRKLTSGPTKCGRYCFLTDFYSMLRLAQFFDSIWGRFFMKKPCFFQCDFLEIFSVFSTWRP